MRPEPVPRSGSCRQGAFRSIQITARLAPRLRVEAAGYGARKTYPRIILRPAHRFLITTSVTPDAMVVFFCDFGPLLMHARYRAAAYRAAKNCMSEGRPRASRHAHPQNRAGHCRHHTPCRRQAAPIRRAGTAPAAAKSAAPGRQAGAVQSIDCTISRDTPGRPPRRLRPPPRPPFSASFARAGIPRRLKPPVCDMLK